MTVNISEEHSQDEQPRGKPGLVQVIGSVLAAGFGVQSSRNRKRDFTQGKATAFIVTGLVTTLVFMAAIYGVVSLVLR